MNPVPRQGAPDNPGVDVLNYALPTNVISGTLTNNPTHPGDFGTYTAKWNNGLSTYEVIWNAEDSPNTQNYLGPDYGRQNYDAQFLGVTVFGGNVYIGIATGQRSDNPYSRYAPGDIRIVVGNDGSGIDQDYVPGPLDVVYGIEVGGGPGGLPAASVLDVIKGDPGTTYSLNGSGYTVPLGANSAVPATQTAGSLWRTGQIKDGVTNGWELDPLASPDRDPTQVHQLSGDSPTSVLIGDVTDYKYAFPAGSQHAFIEVSFPLSDIGLAPWGDEYLQIVWRPSCGNDEVLHATTKLPENIIPEPASVLIWSLLGLGGLGLGVWRRRRNAGPAADAGKQPWSEDNRRAIVEIIQRGRS